MVVNQNQDQNLLIPIKSEQEHCQMLMDVVKLKLHFVHRWLIEHPEDHVAAVLVERVDIWRKTHLNEQGLVGKLDAEHPQWKKWVADISDCYRAFSHVEQRDEFEKVAFSILESSIVEGSKANYAFDRDRDHLRAYNFGSLRCDAPHESRPDTVFLHIANAIAPQSIFADSEYLPSLLIDVLEFAEQQYAVSKIRTHTWLNSHPAWLALFPREWVENMCIEPGGVQWHYGFWGQFINARGCFNLRAGAILRQRGEFPYATRDSFCSIAALKKHLLERR